MVPQQILISHSEKGEEETLLPCHSYTVNISLINIGPQTHLVGYPSSSQRRKGWFSHFVSSSFYLFSLYFFLYKQVNSQPA